MCKKPFYKAQCKWRALLLFYVHLDTDSGILFINVNVLKLKKKREIEPKLENRWVQIGQRSWGKKKKLSLECFLETFGFNTSW